MATDELISQLAAHTVVGVAPRAELEWLAAHGQVRTLEAGEILSRPSEPVGGLYIILSGAIAVFVARAGVREKVSEWRGGEVSGVLPYSRLQAPPGDVVALGRTSLLEVLRAELPALIQHCPAVTTSLVHVMLDRARHFTSSDLLAEKMMSLGKLSAGLAHELNNPASAIARSARALREAMTNAEEAARVLGTLPLDHDQLAAVDELRGGCLAAAVRTVRSPLEQADREAAFADWLAAHGADPGDAETLADTSAELPMLERLARTIPAAALAPVMRWLAVACLTRHLTDEIEQAAVRISNLVTAVKGFTHMDRQATPGPVHVGEGLAQTLAILRAKARAKSAAVHVSVPSDLPPAEGVTGELNQVWANVLDNALDAIGESGTVTVDAAVDGSMLVVRIVDDGPGIPADIRRRIFDPFFTTKGVGQGTGLGLDIVNRVVRKHRGRVTVDSRPGRTEFTISLPLASAPSDA